MRAVFADLEPVSTRRVVVCLALGATLPPCLVLVAGATLLIAVSAGWALETNPLGAIVVFLGGLAVGAIASIAAVVAYFAAPLITAVATRRAWVGFACAGLLCIALLVPPWLKATVGVAREITRRPLEAVTFSILALTMAGALTGWAVLAVAARRRANQRDEHLKRQGSVAVAHENIADSERIHRHCPDCGADNAPGRAECVVCGARL